MNSRKNFCAFLVAVSLVFISTTNSSAFVSGDVDNDLAVRLADALEVEKGTGYFTEMVMRINSCRD